MKVLHLLAALLLVPSLAMPATAPARAKTRAARVFVGTRTAVGNQPRPYRSEGREIIAPSWSAACMSDHGPSQCGEPMWIYRSSEITRVIETAPRMTNGETVSRRAGFAAQVTDHYK